jgi:hypothetical protein
MFMRIKSGPGVGADKPGSHTPSQPNIDLLGQMRLAQMSLAPMKCRLRLSPVQAKRAMSPRSLESLPRTSSQLLARESGDRQIPRP